MHKNGSLIEAREQGMPCAGLVHHKQYFMVPPELRNPKEETVIQGEKGADVQAVNRVVLQ